MPCINLLSFNKLFLCVLFQVTAATANVLEEHGFIVEKRGEIYVKGKGNLETYFVIGRSAGKFKM